MEDRLSKLETSVALVGEKVDRVAEDMQALKKFFLGNEGSPGLLIRIDRLEQDNARLGRLFWIALGSAVAAAIGMVASVLH